MLDVEVELALKGTTESREPSRLRAFGAGGARYDFRLCLKVHRRAFRRLEKVIFVLLHH
jgi:hypothetical protein